MTYEDMGKGSYRWLTRKYNVACVIGKTATMKKESFHKVGSKWKLVSSETEIVNDEHYFNVFSAVPFFRNLGGYERIECNYTTIGHVPVMSISISPDRTIKIVRKFTF